MSTFALVVHALMCIPLITLKVILKQRVNAMLEESFALLPEEEQPRFVVDLLLYSSLPIFLIF